MKRVVIITGSNGGIGKATARLFIDHDWCVVGVDLKEPVEKIPGLRCLPFDLSVPETPARIIREVISVEGRLDALVNNAAVQVCSPIRETRIEDWDMTMAVNVRSAFFLISEALPLLKASGRGAIVNVCSVHAKATSAGLSAYAASKGALLALTRSVALETAGDGVRINSVLPGAVDTDMLRSGLKRAMQDQHLSQDSCLEQLKLRHVLGRIGRPEEIAKAIFFLVDPDQSSFITGQALTVDGGAMARLSTE